MKNICAVILIIFGLIACTYKTSWHNEYYFGSPQDIQIAGYDIQLMLDTTVKEENGHHVIRKGPYRLNLLLMKEYRDKAKINVSKLVINNIKVRRGSSKPFHFSKSFPIIVNFTERFVGKHFNGRYPFYQHNAQFIEEKYIVLDFNGKETVEIEIDLTIENQDGTNQYTIIQTKIFRPELREGEGRAPYLSV